MTQTPNDQISAFFDNEINDSESELVLRRLTRDQSLRDCLGRYALIGDAVRRDRPVPYDLAARVRAALESEAGLSDGSAAAGSAGMPRLARPLVGAAIAAAVALVAIGGLRGLPGPQPGSAAPVVEAQAVSEASAGVMLASEPQSPDSYTVPAVMPAAHQSVEARRQLNTYLVSHSQYATRMGPRGIVPFRAVGSQQPAAMVVPAAANGTRPAASSE